MSLETSLHAQHLALNAKMVDFGGWHMPIAYGSQIEEHHAVRRAAGMFDVSHMTVVDLSGAQARDFLRLLLANDVAKLQTRGRALYSCMLTEEGGVIDDLIVYLLEEGRYRVVVNAATREKDIAWIGARAEQFDVSVREREELAMVAVQGPLARERAARALGEEAAATTGKLKRFCAARCGDLFVARTGYTGEDGFEIVLPAEQAAPLWRRLLDADVTPCGLGARDTLRLEAGLNLYGQDMDETTTPAESNLNWTVSMADEARRFIGRAAITAQMSAGVERKLVGLVLESRGVLRHGQSVQTDAGDGQITSGSWSPTLERAIGLARLPAAASDMARVDIRGRMLEARIVDPPFVRSGEAAPGVLHRADPS